MNDVFYMTQSKIKAQDIIAILNGLGYNCSTVPARQDTWITVLQENLHITWDFVEDQKSSVPLEAETQAVYDKLSPSTLVIISYHNNNISELQNMLYHVLKQYSGWVCCDDYWRTLYTLQAIQQMKCG
jgi:hypothetical protein